MARFHTNPTTGEPGPCHATIACRFGADSAHFDTPEAARAAYEKTAEAEFTPTASLKRAAVTAAPARLFSNSASRNLVGSLMGKDYSTVIADARSRAAISTDYFNKKRGPAASIDFDNHTALASDSTRNDAMAALSARRSSQTAKATLGMTSNSSASVASDARAALAARNANSNHFLAGSRTMNSAF